MCLGFLFLSFLLKKNENEEGVWVLDFFFFLSYFEKKKKTALVSLEVKKDSSYDTRVVCNFVYRKNFLKSSKLLVTT